MSNGVEEEVHVNAPEGLRELMSDISREVLRSQPKKIFEFIANYLSALLITREHGIVSVKILADLCDCKPTLSMHLMDLGLDAPIAQNMAEIIKSEIEDIEPVTGKERVREVSIMKKILCRYPLDEEMCAKICQVIRNAHVDYWYRRKTLEKSIKTTPDEPWEIAAEHTLDLYKKTRPTMAELERATTKIQAAYRAYHVRKELLNHLKPKPLGGPKVQPGPPLDIAESREIDLGTFVALTVTKTDDIETKLSKPKPIPSLKFTSGHSVIMSQTEGKVEKSPDGALPLIRKKNDKDTEEPEYMIARMGTESATYYQQTNKPRISFFAAPPVVIEDLDLDLSQGDEVSDIAEAIDIGHRHSSTATSLIESMEMSDFGDNDQI